MATHSSILTWRIPWTGEPDRLLSMGLQRVGHNSATNTYIHTYIQDLNRYFSKKDTQTANKHEEMLNITNRRGSTNQTHNETLPHVCQDGHRQTHRRQALMRRSGDPGALLGEMRHEAAAIENSVEGSSPKMFR